MNEIKCVHCNKDVDPSTPCVIHTRKGIVKAVCRKCISEGYDWDGHNNRSRQIKGIELRKDLIRNSSKGQTEAKEKLGVDI